MDNNKILYVDVSATGIKKYSEVYNIYFDPISYGTASMGIGDILFNIGAFEESENYSSFADMLENYPEEMLTINLKNDNLKIPILRIHVTDTQTSKVYDYYCLIDNLFNDNFIYKNDLSGHGVCHSAPRKFFNQDCVYINFDGSITLPEVEN